MTKPYPCIYVVDDQPEIYKAVGQTLKVLDVDILTFNCGKDCLKQLAVDDCDLLITDIKMPEMDGLELLRQVKKIKPWLPVLIISGFGDIPMAVKALKLGAFDFVEKPLRRDNLLYIVKTMLNQASMTDKLLGQTLSRTERAILPFIIEGQSSRMIAEKLHRSVRTIELHRQHIMNKMGVANIVDLVHRIHALGLKHIGNNNQ